MPAIQKGTASAACQTLALDPAELDAAYALSLHPLYRYANEKNEMRTLLLCPAAEMLHVLPLLSAMIWCGQMNRYSLHIQIVSDDAEAFRAMLLERMPLLASYTNLCSASPAACYVDFRFDNEPDVALAALRSKRANAGADRAGQRLGERFAGAWTVIAAGKSTPALAGRYLYGLREQDCKSLLVLGCARADLPPETLRNLQLMRQVHFLSSSGHDAARCRFGAWLYDKALRHHLLYQGSKHGRNNEGVFPSGWSIGGQRSSAAAALHMAYKLQDAGLNPRAHNRPALAAKYAREVLGDSARQRDTFCRLTALEHRRWMMYQTVNGWKAASMSRCRSVCFEYDNGLDHPVFRFRIDEGPNNRFHPALVPCRGDLLLQSMTREQWDAFPSEQAIDAADLDPLSKVSLKLHRMAGEKLQASAPIRLRHLNQLKDLALPYPKALEAFDAFREWYLSVGVSDHSLREQQDQFDIVASLYAACGVDAGRTQTVLSRLGDDLRVVNEFYSYCDYETYDTLFIEHLAEIYCRPERLVLLKPAAHGMLDNAVSALLLEPDRVVTLGLDGDRGGRLRSLLRDYIPSDDLICLPADQDIAEILRRLSRCIQRETAQGGQCVIDITGASEAYISAAWRLRSERFPKLSIIRCDVARQRVENLAGFDLAAACRRKITLPVKDMMTLFGARPSSGDSSEQTRCSLLIMRRDFARLWRFSMENASGYRTFFRLMHKNPRVCLPLTPPFDGQTEASLSRRERCELTADAALCGQARLHTLLEQIRLHHAGNFTGEIHECLTNPESVLIVLDGPVWMNRILSGLIGEIGKGTVGELMFEKGIILSRQRRSYHMAATGGQEQEALRAAQAYGIIDGLRIDPDGDAVFELVNAQLDNVFRKKGNRLEYYAWYEASRRSFDSVRNGYEFLWGGEIKNELDILISSGTKLMCVSCKTGPIYTNDDNGKHSSDRFKYSLYEIRLLANQFSCGTKAVLLCLTGDTPHEALFSRAAAMGVSLVVLSDEGGEEPRVWGSGRTLGEELEALMDAPSVTP